MKTIQTLFAAAALSTIAISGAFAGDITISQPWARASAKMAKAGAAFMAIKNDTGKDDTLIGAKADVSDRVELHTHIMDNGVMKMREVKGGIPVPGGETQVLQLGGYHVMFLGLKAPLKEGTTFPLTLEFKIGIEKTVTVDVKGPGYIPKGGHDMKMKGMKH